VHPIAQIGELAVEIGLVVAPRQPVDARGRVPLERIERVPKSITVNVVQERGEPRLLIQPCGLPYAVQALWRALPTLRSERAFLFRVSLGPRPLLHRLRPVARPRSPASSQLMAGSDFSRSFIMRFGS
jgi:hypothetical protein